MSVSPTWRDRAETCLQGWWAARGLPARILWPLSLPMQLALVARRAMVRRRWLMPESTGVPVVVVGNRIAGGAGKTPTVVAVVDHLRSRGWCPGVISRGHGREGDEVIGLPGATSASQTGDEPMLIHKLTRAPVWVGRRRVMAARALRRAHPEVDIIVSDDGLQHLQLGRSVEIIVWDRRGAGNGWLLPAGPLREPADAQTLTPKPLVLYTQGVRSTAADGWLAHRRLTHLLRIDDWFHERPEAAMPLDAFQGRRMEAYAGIANPAGFFQSLREAGIDVTPHPLHDHHPFDPLPWTAGASEVVLTEKDAIKLTLDRLAKVSPETQVWIAPLDFSPEPGFFLALDELLPPPPNAHGHPTP